MTTTQVGTTTGLASDSGFQQAGDNVTCQAEQVYVNVSDEGLPIRIDAWVGYAIPCRIQINKRQAAELSGLLALAVALS